MALFYHTITMCKASNTYTQILSVNFLSTKSVMLSCGIGNHYPRNRSKQMMVSLSHWVDIRFKLQALIGNIFWASSCSFILWPWCPVLLPSIEDVHILLHNVKMFSVVQTKIVCYIFGKVHEPVLLFWRWRTYTNRKVVYERSPAASLVKAVTVSIG